MSWPIFLKVSLEETIFLLELVNKNTIDTGNPILANDLKNKLTEAIRLKKLTEANIRRTRG